ncbi:MAG: chloride channel protein, partial [Thermoanaerobaculales bacterium]|nr:chloride channel protein [Thermoanaerobaculales bacterium]
MVDHRLLPRVTMTTEKLRKGTSRRFASAQFETARFLGLSLLVGVLVGAGAALLIWAIEWVGQGFDWAGESAGVGRYALLVSVPLGLLAAWWVGAKWAPEVSGDGVPEATIGLAVHAGYLPTRSIPLKILVTAFTLGGGGSAGREGPIVQIGATIGSSIARRTGLGEDKIRSLVAAGAGAAIGASFNAPIAGMLFAMEVMLRTFSVRHLSAVVVASVAAAVTNESLV